MDNQNGKPRHDVVVYTAMFGGRDHIVRPPEGDYDWVYFTDEDPNGMPGVVQTPLPVPGDYVRSARLFKTMPQLFFHDYKRWIWLDGSVVFHADTKDLFSWKGPIAVFKHPLRDCIYEEAEILKEQGNEGPEILDAQMQEYRSEGHPEHAGLGTTGTLIRDNLPSVRALNAFWWGEVSTKSKRDQLSFNFGVRKFDLPVEYIEGIYDGNRWLRVMPHKGRPIGATG